MSDATDDLDMSLDEDFELADDLYCCHHGVSFDEECEACADEDEEDGWPDEYDGILGY